MTEGHKGRPSSRAQPKRANDKRREEGRSAEFEMKQRRRCQASGWSKASVACKISQFNNPPEKETHIHVIRQKSEGVGEVS